MRLSALLLVLVASLMVARMSPAAVTAEKCGEDKVVIKIDGQPFTEYLTKSGSKPILWPILGPTGKAMTRFYPMGEAPNERQDHIHQRSFWFTHGEVNGIDFWAETGTRMPLGTQVHKGFDKIASGDQAVVVTRNDWLDPTGKKVLEDVRKLAFGTLGASRWIDFDITLIASNGPVVFGDTKEGSFGIRVAETMKVDAKLGGRIINSNGLEDKDAWGKSASWVDYQGPVEGETLGIAIFNHPSSFRYPTHWHVRTYGLYAVNPFGTGDFKRTGKNDPNDQSGRYEMPAGQSINLRYRVLLHKGDEKQAQVAEAFAAYAKQPK